MWMAGCVGDLGWFIVVVCDVSHCVYGLQYLVLLGLKIHVLSRVSEVVFKRYP